jgi:3-oxoacyl-[acyl-carrier-protein] synthase III
LVQILKLNSFTYRNQKWFSTTARGAVVQNVQAIQKAQIVLAKAGADSEEADLRLFSNANESMMNSTADRCLMQDEPDNSGLTDRCERRYSCRVHRA